MNNRQQSILNKTSVFTDFQLWPTAEALNPERWLNNFREEELEIGLILLDNFTFIPNRVTKQLFRSAFDSIVPELVHALGVDGKSISRAELLQQIIVTRLTGEEPSDTDSGYIFARFARQHLGFTQEQILSPEQAIAEIMTGSKRVVLFVDDFVGSGNQFRDNWNRKYNIFGSELSFAAVASEVPGVSCFYIPLIATEYGLGQLRGSCSRAMIFPVHVLGPEYSLSRGLCKAWPAGRGDEMVGRLREISFRAGLPELGWEGFHRLSLPIAFEHSVPDSTLPLYYFSSAVWIPLINITV